MPLEIGKPAPDFSQKDQNGNMINLSDFRGKKVLLYFYPQDNTPTCTIQSCNLNDNLPDLKKAGYEVIGVSEDNEKSHQKFIKKFSLGFTLISDVDHQLIDKYDVWGEKTTFGKTYMGLRRTTFLIDENGILTHIIDKVESKKHAEQVMNS
ncbi:MAG: thioredoxin-dependent thiol peroxidase [Bacteroidota bacterium]